MGLLNLAASVTEYQYAYSDHTDEW